MKTRLNEKKSDLFISYKNLKDLMKNPMYSEVLEDLIDREVLLQIDPKKEDLADWALFKKNLK